MNDENIKDNHEYKQEETQTMMAYETENNTIGMMQKMNIKLPTPTQFDGRHPQFYEWTGKVKAADKAYLSITMCALRTSWTTIQSQSQQSF
eukprot:740727-Amphidinium_carterae.2